MNQFGSRIVEFLTEATTWSGPGSIPVRLWEHIWISTIPVVIAALVTIPPAAVLAHHRKGTLIASSLVNIGRAVPSFGILAVSVVLLIGWLGLGAVLAFPALIALAAPPMFTNTVTGVVTVPPQTVEAARGMGMTEREILRRVEIPLALPVITEGIRVAFVQVIATATLAALVAGPGLGRFIVDGFAKQRGEGELFVGAVLVALLAVLAEAGFGVVERAVTPGGLRRR
jgi:osmoprotectant transport system permease protein